MLTVTWQWNTSVFPSFTYINTIEVTLAWFSTKLQTLWFDVTKIGLCLSLFWLNQLFGAGLCVYLSNGGQEECLGNKFILMTVVVQNYSLTFDKRLHIPYLLHQKFLLCENVQWYKVVTSYLVLIGEHRWQLLQQSTVNYITVKNLCVFVLLTQWRFVIARVEAVCDTAVG